MNDADYTLISLDTFDLIIITINQNSWNNIDKLKSIYTFIKEHKAADFRLMIDNGEENTISAELNERGAIITINRRIAELENTNK